MPEGQWNSFDAGRTLGKPGSEGGPTLRDEEHTLGARITLERDTDHSIPFAISCGIYGCMVHTRFFSGEEEACRDYELMRDSLGELLDKVEQSGAEEFHTLIEGASDFVDMYP